MYIAQKPCSFGGHKFKIGESVPKELVLPSAVRRLTKGGVIAEVGNAGHLLPASTSIESTEEAQEVSVPILAEEGVTTARMTIDELLGAIETIQKEDDEIIADFSKIENEDVLIFIDVMKNAESPIHEAAEARASEIVQNADTEKEIPDTESDLMRMKRDELAEIAAGYGMTVEEEHTKKMLTAYILEAQQKAGE